MLLNNSNFGFINHAFKADNPPKPKPTTTTEKKTRINKSQFKSHPHKYYIKI